MSMSSINRLESSITAILRRASSEVSAEILVNKHYIRLEAVATNVILTLASTKSILNMQDAYMSHSQLSRNISLMSSQADFGRRREICA